VARPMPPAAPVMQTVATAALDQLSSPRSPQVAPPSTASSAPVT
jgi:hypothetical protein